MPSMHVKEVAAPEPETRRNSKLDKAMRGSINSECSVKTDLRVEEMIDDPIGCGFLLRYCVRQHNEENLNFIIEVNRFREVFSNIDVEKQIWTKTCAQIEAMGVDPAAEESPPPLAAMLKEMFLDSQQKMAVKWSELEMLAKEADERMKHIFAHFLSEEAPTPICISQKLLQDTIHRMHNISLYGPEVFAETCLDPIKTLCRDIMPRFLKSDLCSAFKARRKECREQPNALELVVPPPAVDLRGYSAEDRVVTKRFALADLLKEGFLYGEFLLFLQGRVCAENLLCYRLVICFEEVLSKKNYEAADHLAWTIYRYFVALGAPFEISCHPLDRCDVMRHLAKPTPDIFNAVKRSALEQLSAYLTLYSKTPTYKALGAALNERVERSEKRALQEEAKRASTAGAWINSMLYRSDSRN